LAEEVQIRNSQAVAKVRNPLAPALLPFITFGIYALVWYYKINKEMAELGRSRNTKELGDSPGTSLLAVTLGAFIIVPAVISVYHTCQRVQKSQQMAGSPEPTSAGLLFVLAIFLGPVAYYLMQAGLNKVWEGERQGGSPSELAGGSNAEMPQQQAVAQPAPPPPPPAQ